MTLISVFSVFLGVVFVYARMEVSEDNPFSFITKIYRTFFDWTPPISVIYVAGLVSLTSSFIAFLNSPQK